MENLTGLRKLWYANGKPYIVERFSKGRRVGHRLIYSESGQLVSDVSYKNDLITESIGYYDSAYVTRYYLGRIAVADDPYLKDDVGDSKVYKRLFDSVKALKSWGNQVAYRTVYSKDGRNFKSEHFNTEGKPSETRNYSGVNETDEVYRYFRNGKMEMYLKYDKKANKQIEHDYAKDGTRKEFVNSCGVCDVIFKKDAPPAGTPEKVYIQ